MVGFFIALLSGALMSIQGVFNTEVTKTTGMWVGNAWVHLTAFAVCLIAWLIAGRDNPMVLMKVEPRYLLLGGVIGINIYINNIYTRARTGTGTRGIIKKKIKGK